MSHLYLHHFGLAKPPFQITPDLEFFFSGGRRGDILNAIASCRSSRRRHNNASCGSRQWQDATGSPTDQPPGRGCLHSLSSQSMLQPRRDHQRNLSRFGPFSNISLKPEEKLAALNQELLRRHSLGQRVLLVVDEAHLMPAESLEEIRLLSNLETGQHKLINIFLFGQPELDSLIGDPKLRQVRDRVSTPFRTRPPFRETRLMHI
jgi:MSHA biogenesis protein MshM